MRHGARSEQDGHRSDLTHAQSDRLAGGSPCCGCGDEPGGRRQRAAQNASCSSAKAAIIRFGELVGVTLKSNKVL